MQYCRGGKKSKCFSPGSDFTEQISSGEHSRMDSAGLLRQGVVNIFLKETCMENDFDYVNHDNIKP